MKRVRCREVYNNPWLRLREDVVVRDGKEEPYSVVERADSVIIVALSEAQETVLLLQDRYPTESKAWELPMGGIDADESALEAAVRELREETGLAGGNVQEVGWFYPVPALMAQRCSVFVVAVASSELQAMSNDAGGMDDIVGRRVVRADEVQGLIDRAEITDGFTLCGLLLSSSRFGWNSRVGDL